MRTGGYTIQQTLTTEAASVLKHSLTLARRRGHAQVTPLHVAATLLSSRTSLLRRACIKSHPGFSTNYQFAPSRLHHHHHNQNHPLQCRALELCFNVALNRLPTVPGPMFHGQPSLANALVAALKRAQAHQRRGCIEQQQQQQTQQTQPQTQQTQLLAVKVELEQLVISILDDPSVSRVMREAGFNSTAVKNCVEDCSVSSVFYGGSVAGVFSSPNSPDQQQQQQHHNNINRFHHYQNPKDFNFINPNFPLWQTHFLNQSPDQNPLLISSSSSHHHHQQQRLREIDLKLVVDVLLRKKTKKKNPVIVGDSVSFTEGFASELMAKLESGEIDQTGELKQTHFVKFQFSPMESKFMRREDVETNIKELRKKVMSLTASGKNVIIFTGDLKWTVKEITNNSNGGLIDEISSSYSPLDHIVEEMGKLIAEFNDDDDDDCKTKRVWVMGTASFQTYMRCQMRQPSLETLWALHPVSVPSSANLGLSLHATSGHEARTMSSVNATKSFSGYNNKAEEVEETISSVLSCCPECVTSFEREAKALKANQEKLLPSWLQSHDADNNSSQKEELIGLRRKWNKFCEHLHSQTGQLSMMGKNYPYGLPYGSSNESSKSISLIDSLGLKPNQRATNSIAKFRRQNSCTIEFDLGGNEYEKGESINEAEDDKGNETITLDLGRSLFRSDSVTERGKKMSALVKALEESNPGQTVTMRLIAESLIDCVSKKKDGWIMIEGRDTAAKRRLARTVSESVFGSLESLVHIDLKKKGSESKVSSETLLACGLENHEKVVFLIEDIDLAESRFLKLLADRFEEKRRMKGGIDHRQAIFILTKEDSSNARNRDSVLQIGLEITAHSPGKKRKPEWDVSVREGKNSKAGEIENRFWIKKEVCSRQSSFNSSYLDLNIKAEEEGEGEISPITSDLTGEEEDTEFSSSNFLNRIQNRFVLKRSCEPGIERAMITAAFREVFPEGEERDGVRFSVEDKLVEELCGGGGYIQNGAFESWLKEVFQTGLLTVKKGGKKDTDVIRMVFGGIADNKGYGGGVGGYMGTFLPNKVQVSKFE
ncbi:PREDICTED: protein SMAX1-LIKE 5-like [Camelina sativa]|uniref:Protein SMAX1-LIKE 5-like n=1 Tax=Camelina sativa TaxID=90675 RepID=A0ABM0XAU9_CAMSA|nr:PREDICTED: protein SMAX1-LIKE 5-like [Camelina sativa]